MRIYGSPLVQHSVGVEVLDKWNFLRDFANWFDTLLVFIGLVEACPRREMSPVYPGCCEMTM